MVSRRKVTDVRRLLEAAEAASPVRAVDQVARELGLAFGAAHVSFLVTDLSGRALVRLAHVPIAQDPAPHGGSTGQDQRRAEEESASTVPFDGGPEEQAVRTQTIQVLPPDGAAARAGVAGMWRVLAPVTERGESIGLLEMYLPDAPDPESVDEIAQVAHLLAFVVIANRRHTDLFEWGQRSREFSLSAEIQQRLLPESRTCEAAAFTLAAWLEPAATIAGDTFDYSQARDSLHLSLTDAMGHGVNSALTASVCLGGLRGARRQGLSLLDQASATNSALAEHADSRAGDDFVTGMIGRVDLDTGTIEVINAGHVPPYLLRRSEVTMLDLKVDLPFGLFAESTYESTRVSLEPGDRLVFVTDGMLERNVAGIDLAGSIRDTAALHPREVVRVLADRALEAAGHALEDDAAVLILDWHGRHEESRDSVSGADPSRASGPHA
ncbi:PP2C family protein-serine/threonine phosphatase [Nocardioides jishulii]|uniref:Serine/threonine-protein phosphatase n=1 Tax=Nocardioides jishulii TaxID=2575440 RepID=A0A4U2YK00_9ACTN|nr:PP2C family protein-serine/threonine phosphatase [Nocardioides jishulii]QCX26966.1 serine/threonine-protein phosphatase [Nocardioides jishulii]TKI61449.1 serine/threonine-protein phosphatase [Nocardioides jishulii]